MLISPPMVATFSHDRVSVSAIERAGRVIKSECRLGPGEVHPFRCLVKECELAKDG